MAIFFKYLDWKKVCYCNDGTGRKTKLTVEIVKAIREEREKTGKSYDKIAKQYGISKATVADLIKRRTWKNV